MSNFERLVDSLAQQGGNSNTKMKVLNVRIQPDLHKRVRVHCVQNSMTMEAFAAQALEEKLAREEGKQSG